MPNVTRGGRMPGLMVYLAGPGRRNEHVDQHLVAGDPAIMAWHDDAVLDRQSALAIAKALDEPWRAFGTEVKGPLYRWDAAKNERVKIGYGDTHVWHCSLSLSAPEGQLPDEAWAQLANDFVDRMGFTEMSGKVPARWVAVRHGLSAAGNDHIHIAVSLVREDGTKVGVWNDFQRAQDVVGELEQTYGLQVLESREAGRGTRGVSPAEQARQKRLRLPEPERVTLARRLRAVATASRDEAEFVRRARREGLLLRPRYAAGREDVVLGYSVAARPAAGERAVWIGGGQVARDLALPRLREQWPDTPQGASHAVGEWTAARRGQRPVAPGREHDEPDPALWQQYAQEIGDLSDRLRAVPVEDTDAWAQVARETSGAFAAWSLRTEAIPGPLADASDQLARFAQVRAGRSGAPRVTSESFVGLSRMLLVVADGGQSRTSQAIMLRQLLNTMYSLWEMQKAVGQAQTAAGTERVVRDRLALVAARLAEGSPGTVAGPAPAPAQQRGPVPRSPVPNPLAARPRSASTTQGREGGIER